MIERAILENVLYELHHSPLSDVIPNEVVVITSDELPPPSTGQYFVLLHGVNRINLVAQNDPSSSRIEDRFFFNIVCGCRSRLAPNDRRGYYFSKEHESLQVIKDLVITVVSKLGAANNVSLKEDLEKLLKSYPESVQTLLGTNFDFIRNFEFLDADSEPVPRFPDYFTSTDQPESQSIRPAGHTLTCKFVAPIRTYRTLC